MKKLVLFGAGKIGRSFIGQLFSQGGYEVVFIDISTSIIDAINKEKKYTIVVKSDKGDQSITIQNIRGLYLTQKEAIYRECLTCDLIATAVGPANLLPVIEIIGVCMKNRLSLNNRSPVDIIIAENLRNAGSFFRDKLQAYLTKEEIEQYIGLIETSIGKMVPIMSESDSQDDALKIFAEPYNTLILDKKGFKNKLPDIPGLAPKENMKAWVDRKSFIHNLGHVAAAYYGYYLNNQYRYLFEALENPLVLQHTRDTMLQAGKALRLRYPGEFSEEDIIRHSDDLIRRFKNKSLGDTIYRVGMDVPRKLSPDDRIIGAIQMAVEVNSAYDFILKTLVYGIYFRGRNEQGNLYEKDQWFANQFDTHGFEWVFNDICKLDAFVNEPIIKKLLDINCLIKTQSNNQ